mmetsp:Transcript_40459/g.131007  ORF Transcript_40459/g.131007 Transcript_40459/m.131007 type:complete len:224 (+) Transcript_40459:423-1094(+)
MPGKRRPRDVRVDAVPDQRHPARLRAAHPGAGLPLQALVPARQLLHRHRPRQRAGPVLRLPPHRPGGNHVRGRRAGRGRGRVRRVPRHRVCRRPLRDWLRPSLAPADRQGLPADCLRRRHHLHRREPHGRRHQVLGRRRLLHGERPLQAPPLGRLPPDVPERRRRPPGRRRAGACRHGLHGRLHHGLDRDLRRPLLEERQRRHLPPPRLLHLDGPLGHAPGNR